MKPSLVLFALGGTLFAVKFIAGYQSAQSANAGALPNWYPSSLAAIDAKLPIKLDYVLLGAGVVAHLMHH